MLLQIYSRTNEGGDVKAPLLITRERVVLCTSLSRVVKIDSKGLLRLPSDSAANLEKC